MYAPKTTIKDTKNSWVVFKRIKKQNWYYRGRSTCSQYACSAYLFSTKEAALEKVAALNLNRKAYRFKIDCAEKHFVSNWNISVSSWEKEVVITNNPIAFADLVNRKKQVNQSLNSLKQQAQTSLEGSIKDTVTSLSRIEARYQDRIKSALSEKEEDTKRALETQTKLNAAKNWLNTTDLDKEYVEKYQTESDKKAYILFGKKEEDKPIDKSEVPF